MAPDPWAGQYPETSSHEVRRPGRRAWVAGVSAVLFLGGSAGGYAAGHRSAGDAPAPGVGTQDGQRPGLGAPDGDGFGRGSDDPSEGSPGAAQGDAQGTGFTAEGGNAG
jgi:hypothetical protein